MSEGDHERGDDRSIWLDERQRSTLSAVMDHLVPPDGVSPGAGAAGGATYVDHLLGAFTVDPPRIWAGGPYSGRHGGTASFEDFLDLGPWEALAWRTRIEGSLGRPEREHAGAVRGWQQIYDDGLRVLGDDYADLPADVAADRLAATDADFRDLVFVHACESLYGDPVYGGNRDGVGWTAIDYRGDVQPAGYTDDEVSAPFGGSER